MDFLLPLILKRTGFAFLTLFTISLLIFVGLEALPGDTAQAILGQGATEENLAALRKEMKLDLPVHTRYVSWLKDISHGDLGNSLSNGRPVSEMIGWRFQNTLLLAFSAAMVSIPLAIILGLVCALYQNSWLDRILSTSTLSAISFPEFFVAYILILVFVVQFEMFPSVALLKPGMGMMEIVNVLVLPCLTLTLVVLAHMMRMTRATIIGVLSSPYIEMAQLKGVRKHKIILYHALPNALGPIINVVVMDLAWLVVGVVVVEVVFVYPGLGQLLVDSVSKRDIPVVQTSGLIFACTYIFLNLTADVLSIISNPRLRHPK
ncbi:MAG: ABC transporter permease [Desulfobacterium sp.]|jgi:peptide/nickel transport system permease protein|nr:ABC transporter permease [Desulfobacterium sp.]